MSWKHECDTKCWEHECEECERPQSDFGHHELMRIDRRDDTGVITTFNMCVDCMPNKLSALQYIGKSVTVDEEVYRGGLGCCGLVTIQSTYTIEEFLS